MIKNRILAAVLVMLTGFATAADDVDNTWYIGMKSTADISYGKHDQQKLDIHNIWRHKQDKVPSKKGQSNRPTLMWIHGGGWMGGDKAREMKGIVPYLKRGWNVVNVNYRIGKNTAPKAVDDVLCAYKWIKDNGAKYKLNTDHIVVSGTSAGGHLSLMVGLRNSAAADHPCKAEPPKAVIDWFGITNIKKVDEFFQNHREKKGYAHAWVGEQGMDKISKGNSPVHFVTDKAPPIMIIHGTADNVVPYVQGVTLHNMLTTKKQLISMKDKKHGNFTTEQFVYAYDQIFKFLGFEK